MYERAFAGICLGAVLACSGSAAAAQDPTPDWSGTYVGIGVGGKFISTDVSNIQFSTPNGTIVPNTTSFSRNVQAVRLDLFTGHDWQPRPKFVIGVGGELGYGFNATSSSTLEPTSFTVNGVTYTANGANAQSFLADYVNKTNLDSNFRLRAGYAKPRMLLYVASGLAIETQRASLYNTPTSSFTAPNGTTYQVNPGYDTSKSTTRQGGSIGVGAEGRLTPKLAVRFEWRYEIFPSRDNTFKAQNAAYSASNTTSGNEQVLNVGLSYRFHGRKRKS